MIASVFQFWRIAKKLVDLLDFHYHVPNDGVFEVMVVVVVVVVIPPTLFVFCWAVHVVIIKLSIL